MNTQSRKTARLAARLHVCLGPYAGRRPAGLERRLSTLCNHLEDIRRLRDRLAGCLERNWLRAADSVIAQLSYSLQDLSLELASCQQAAREPQQPAPTVRQIHEEILQLEEEFDDVGYRGQDKCLAAVTEPIVLEDLFLGRFEIQLGLEGSGQPDPQQALRIIALEPNPAAGKDSVTHPHVEDERLCPGDASAVMRASLEGGRICDLFMLIRSVLTTYNPSSPYVSLDDWHGRACRDCGYTTNEDRCYYCESCEEDFCEACISSCQHCRTTLCQRCLSQCSLCEEACCDGCLTACAECGDSGCPGCLEEDLCVTCRETQEETDENENQQQPQDAPKDVPSGAAAKEVVPTVV